VSIYISISSCDCDASHLIIVLTNSSAILLLLATVRHHIVLIHIIHMIFKEMLTCGMCHFLLNLRIEGLRRLVVVILTLSYCLILKIGTRVSVEYDRKIMLVWLKCQVNSCG